MRFFLFSYCVAQAWVFALLARHIQVSAAGQPDGKGRGLFDCCQRRGRISGARSCDGALPSRTDAAGSFAAGRKAWPARALAGNHKAQGCPHYAHLLGLTSSPRPARFFMLPQALVKRQSVNRRTHRLAFFLFWSRAINRYG
jgi:hypothetical protein